MAAATDAGGDDVRLGLIGDTMLGRTVAARLDEVAPDALLDPELVAVAHQADVLVANLECCISTRGERWPQPGKPFFFRAPPAAIDTLRTLGVDVVTLANNHALDFGRDALADTLQLLADAGIAVAGADLDVASARTPATVVHDRSRVAVVGLTDHPADFAAGPDLAGVAFADLRTGVPEWVTRVVAATAEAADVVVVSPHWGPNMTTGPVPHVRAAAEVLARAGATVVAGHSAHVFHGVTVPHGGAPVIYDLGDFLDDYAVDPRLRNDLGLLWFVDVEVGQATRIEAVPIALDHCFTRLADRDEAAWIRDRFVAACVALGTDVTVSDGRLAVTVTT